MIKKSVLIILLTSAISLSISSFIQAKAVEADYYYYGPQKSSGLGNNKNSGSDKESTLNMLSFGVEINKALMDQRESVLFLANKLKEEEAKRVMLEEQVKDLKRTIEQVKSLKKTIQQLNEENMKLAQENKALTERVAELEDRFNKLIVLLSETYKNKKGKK